MFSKKKDWFTKPILILAEAIRVLVVNSDWHIYAPVCLQRANSFSAHVARVARAEGQTLRRPDHVFWHNIIFEVASLLFILQATSFKWIRQPF
jgi:hypothetical protein